MDCTNLDLNNASVDLVLGIALIHHLTVDQELKLYEECYRVLKEGGTAIFLESLIESRIVDFIRTLIPIYQRHNPRPSRLSKEYDAYRLMEKRVHPERPNTNNHYKQILGKLSFSEFELIRLSIFNRLDRFTINKKVIRKVHDIDYRIQRFVPFKNKLFREVIIRLTK